MAKKIQLSIPKPCHENWDAMTPVEKGKFCGSCAKEVVDFSTMSDRQVAEFFKKPSTGSVCGRFMVDQLERDIEIPKKRLPWFKYFFSIALPAFFFSKADAQNGQKMGRVKPATTDTIPTNIKHEYRTMGMVALPDKFIPVEKGTQKGEPGRVVDASTNMPLPAAQIHLYSTIGKEKIYVQRDGSFIIDIYRKITVDRIEISLPGYITQTLKLADFMKLANIKEPIKLERGEMIVGKIAMVDCVKPAEGDTFNLINDNSQIEIETPRIIEGVVLYENLEPVIRASVLVKERRVGVATDKKGYFRLLASPSDILSISGGIDATEVKVGNETFLKIISKRPQVTVGEVVRVTTKSVQPQNSFPVIPVIKTNTPNNVKIFPNPAPGGQSISIVWKPTEEGYHNIELINPSGHHVFQKEIWIDAEAKLLDLEIPNVPAGSYFLVMTNKKTGKKFSEKLVVQ